MGDTDQKSFAEAWGEIVARSWQDEAFKARLVSDPKSVLKEYGVDTSDEMKIAVSDGSDVWIFPLPPKPTLDSDVGYCSSYFCCTRQPQ